MLRILAISWLVLTGLGLVAVVLGLFVYALLDGQREVALLIGFAIALFGSLCAALYLTDGD